MLGQAPGLSHAQSQSSIRHQVRKLRAKVKSLVPIDMCQHYQKRNQRIAKLERLQEQWQKDRETSINESLWKVTSGFNSSHSEYLSKRHIIEYSNQKQGKQFRSEGILKKVSLPYKKFVSSQLKYDQEESPLNPATTKQADDNIVQRHQFQKLTPTEIQQINEDKIYYLGENNIQPYNQFLKKYESELLKKNNQPAFTHKIKYSSSLHNHQRREQTNQKKQNIKEQTKREKNYHHKLWSSQKNIRANSEVIKRNRNSYQINSNAANFMNNQALHQIDEDSITPAHTQRKTVRREFKNLEERKLFIKEQTDGDIDYHKTRLKERQNKSQANYRQVCYSKFFKFKKNSSQTFLKINRALDKKTKMLQDDGDIKNINEILRQKIILKKANQQKKTDTFLQKTSPQKLQV